MVVQVHTRLDPIELDECLRLLADHHLGRLAVVVDGQPLVYPMNYALSGRQIVFRTDPGTKLDAAAGRQVAFEIDGADVLYHDGWSVLVVGRAREEKDQARLREFALLPLSPWASGPKAHWMCIAGGAITGRRLSHADRE
jgi:nitroimidazol reductase NimA-like FMN-containing flavoprotein (pyridoxamine 5'-phosphate oxidase superfamily)